MMPQNVPIPVRERVPAILTPLIALIGSITLFLTLIDYHYSYTPIAVLYGLTTLILGAAAYHRPAIRSIMLMTMISILCGFLRMASLYHSYHSFPFSNEPTTIEGTILDKEKTEQPRMPQCLTIAMNTITRGACTTPTIHVIQLYTAPSPDLEIGDHIRMEQIVLKKPNGNDFGRYLMKEGILTALFVPSLTYRVIHRPAHSFRRWFLAYKKDLLGRFKQKLSPPTYHLFASLFLGVKNKKALETINRQFKYWGIVHYLARSGLHLTVVITIYEAALRFIPLPFMARHFLLLFLGVLYYLLSWSSISFIRAFIMFLYYKFSALAQLPTHFLHILLATCYLILLANPLQLFFLDFQLSFLLTFALGWLNLYKTE